MFEKLKKKKIGGHHSGKQRRRISPASGGSFSCKIVSHKFRKRDKRVKSYTRRKEALK